MPGRFEIRAAVVRRPRHPRRVPFLERLFVEVGVRVGAGLLLVAAVTLAMRVGVTGLLLDGVLFAPLLLLLPLAIWFARKRRHASLTVGADGIEVQRFGANRFIPYSSVRRISRDGQYLVLDERARPPLRLLVETHGAEWRGHLEQILERIEEARAGYGKADLPPPLEALVAGAAQCNPTWLAHLRGAARREDYREGPLTPETLWPIVEDASVAPHERIAAAVALRADLDEAGKSRLRIAVESTLAPRIRIALEAALDENDEQLTQSFAELARDRVRAPP